MGTTLPEEPLLPVMSSPAFVVLPPTTSTQPYQLQPGHSLEVKVVVENRSNTVDWFHLICSNLPVEFYTIHYPDGYRLESSGLELHPGDRDTIRLVVHPPAQVAVGDYCLLISLVSSHYAEIGLPEAVHFQIPSVHELETSLEPGLVRVGQEAGGFQILLDNQGNVERHLILQAKSEVEGSDVCTYSLEPAFVQLTPGERACVDLKVKPIGAWRRPFLGQGRLLKFAVHLKDLNEYPLLKDHLQGTLIWRSYTLAQGLRLLLPLLLAVGGGLGAIAALSWWLLPKSPSESVVQVGAKQSLNKGGAELDATKTLPAPQIVKFSSSKSVYKQVVDTTTQGASGTQSPVASNALGSSQKRSPVLLNWEIAHPRQVQELRVVGFAANGKTTSTLQRYSFVDSQLPEALDEYCTLQENLVCSEVPTNANTPGDHWFRLTVIPKPGQKSAQQTQMTERIRIEPPQPQSIAKLSLPPNQTPKPTTENSPGKPANRQPSNGSNPPDQRDRPQTSVTPSKPTISQPKPAVPLAKPKPIPPPTPLISARTNHPFTGLIPTQPNPIRPPKPKSKPATQSPLVTSRSASQAPADTNRSNAQPAATPSTAPSSNGGGEDANALVRGLTVARQQGKINPNGAMWRKIQTAVKLLRRGASRESAARQSGVPLSILDILIANGEWKASARTNAP